MASTDVTVKVADLPQVKEFITRLQQLAEQYREIAIDEYEGGDCLDHTLEASLDMLDEEAKILGCTFEKKRAMRFSTYKK